MASTSTARPEPETPTTLPSPPFVHLKGIPNFRDLGGYKVAPEAESKPGSGRRVRRNYIFRCGEPTKATDEAVAKIRELGVTHIFDLRSRPEIEKQQVSASEGSSHVIAWPGVERVYCPVFPEESYDPVSLAQRYAQYSSEGPDGMLESYKYILKHGATAYTTVFRHMLAHPPPDNALIIHCTAGKDRTGVLGALILSLCGVPDAIVADEYNLTEAGLGAWTELLVAAVLKTHPGGPTPEAEAGARRMVGARRESILNILQLLHEQYGGAQGYLEQVCGLSHDETERIKAFLVVDEAEAA